MRIVSLIMLLPISLYSQLAVSILDFSGEDVESKVLKACYNQLEESLIESNRSEVGVLCSSIASELEQSNWVNFPEDYEASEIEEKKNQIREIRTKGREIRANIDATQSLEELSELDLNIIPLPEPEELTE